MCETNDHQFGRGLVGHIFMCSYTVYVAALLNRLMQLFASSLRYFCYGLKGKLLECRAIMIYGNNFVTLHISNISLKMYARINDKITSTMHCYLMHKKIPKELLVKMIIYDQ